MVFIIIFTFIYLLAFFLDIRKLYKNKKYKEFWIITIFMAITYILQISDLLGVKIPSPNKGMIKLIELIGLKKGA